MPENSHANYVAKVGRKSDGNIILQGSEILNPVFFMGSDTDMLNMAATMGRYDVIQERIASYLEAAKRTHPLFPEFSAEYNAEMKKLVSTPETADAFDKHPKIIKGTYRLDYSQYPYMSRDETPWAYAYRTQTPVQMDTMSYQEFLGEIEDPFPVLTYSEGMTTIINAPEFPDAVEAHIESGDVAIPFQLRRLPCMEYGWTIFGNVSGNHGFDIRIKANEGEKKTTVTFKKIFSAPLEVQLLREKLFTNMESERKMRITVGGKELLSFVLSDENAQLDIITAAKHFSKHISNLLFIEQRTGCRFTCNLSEISVGDYNMAQMLASSIKGGWYITKEKFNDDIHADYDRVAEEILEKSDGGEFASESTVIMLSLYDHKFTAENANMVFRDARISNIGSVKRSVRKKRRNIRIVVKPMAGREYFLKYIRFNGLKCLC